MRKILYKALAVSSLFLMQSAHADWLNNGGLPYDQMTRPHSAMRRSIDWSECQDCMYKFSCGSSGEFLFDGEGHDKNGHTTGLYQYLSPRDAENRPVESYEHFFRGSAVEQSPSGGVNFTPGASPNTWGEKLRGERDRAATNDHGIQGSLIGGNYTLGAVPVDVYSAATNLGNITALKGDRTETNLVCMTSIATEHERSEGTLRLSAYLPIRLISCSEESFGITGTTFRGALVPAELRPEVVSNVLARVGGLSTGRWSQDNVLGDLWLMGSWHRSWDLNRDFVQGWHLMVQAGLSIPTGNRRNEDNVYSVATGTGALGVPLNVCADVDFVKGFTATGSLDLYIVTDETTSLRVRKYDDVAFNQATPVAFDGGNKIQGELVLPEKILARRNTGSLMRFTASVDWTSPCGYWWAGAGYTYCKKFRDHLTTDAQGYSQDVIKASQRWEKANYQNLNGHFGIDMSSRFERFCPKMSVWVRWPLSGKRVPMFKALGLDVSVKI